MAACSHRHLQGAADEELSRSLPQDEVSSLEDVPAGPHDHHGETHPIRRLVLKIPVELWHSQHGLSQDCHQPNRFHKPGEVDQKIHQEAT